MPGLSKSAADSSTKCVTVSGEKIPENSAPNSARTLSKLCVEPPSSESESVCVTCKRSFSAPLLRFQQFEHVSFHLVSDLPHALDRLAFGILQRPVESSQARDVGTGFTATHGDQ